MRIRRRKKAAQAPNAGKAAVVKKPTSIRLTVLGGTERIFDYTENMTVKKLLEEADITLADGQMVAVDGHKAGLETVLKAGTVVTITSAIKNG